MKMKKFYAVRYESEGMWKMELDAEKIVNICHEGAGCEMCDDKLTIEFTNGTTIKVDEIVCL